jgi:hypothetical protein
VCSLHVFPWVESASSSFHLYCFLTATTFLRFSLCARAMFYFSGLSAPSAKFISAVCQLPLDRSFVLRYYLVMYPFRVLGTALGLLLFLVSIVLRVTHNVHCATDFSAGCQVLDFPESLWLVAVTMITLGCVCAAPCGPCRPVCFVSPSPHPSRDTVRCLFPYNMIVRADMVPPRHRTTKVTASSWLAPAG